MWHLNTYRSIQYWHVIIIEFECNPCTVPQNNRIYFFHFTVLWHTLFKFSPLPHTSQPLAITITEDLHINVGSLYSFLGNMSANILRVFYDRLFVLFILTYATCLRVLFTNLLLDTWFVNTFSNLWVVFWWLFSSLCRNFEI